jgi:ABC-type antimicrobial peptide transport system permease subunit
MANVLREGLLLVATGATIGLLGLAALSQVVAELLYGVQPIDGLTLSGVTLLLTVLALAAAAVPALRVSKIDPQSSLRSE